MHGRSVLNPMSAHSGVRRIYARERRSCRRLHSGLTKARRYDGEKGAAYGNSPSGTRLSESAKCLVAGGAAFGRLVNPGTGPGIPPIIRLKHGIGRRVTPTCWLHPGIESTALNVRLPMSHFERLWNVRY